MKKIMSFMFVLGLLLTPTAGLFAESYEGGTWEHGAGSWVWSNYLHNSVTHYAKVHNTKSETTTCKDATKTNWAKASQIQAPGDQVPSAGHGGC